MGFVRSTSLEAYRDIQHELPNRRKMVLGVFYERPDKRDWTVREISEYLRIDSRSVAPRIHELAGMGLIEESCKRYCGVTQRRVLSWRLATRIRAR